MIECLVPIFMRLWDNTQTWSKAISPHAKKKNAILVYDDKLHFIV